MIGRSRSWRRSGTVSSAGRGVSSSEKNFSGCSRIEVCNIRAADRGKSAPISPISTRAMSHPVVAATRPGPTSASRPVLDQFQPDGETAMFKDHMWVDLRARCSVRNLQHLRSPSSFCGIYSSLLDFTENGSGRNETMAAGRCHPARIPLDVEAGRMALPQVYVIQIYAQDSNASWPHPAQAARAPAHGFWARGAADDMLQHLRHDVRRRPAGPLDVANQTSPLLVGAATPVVSASARWTAGTLPAAPRAHFTRGPLRSSQQGRVLRPTARLTTSRQPRGFEKTPASA